MKKNVLVVALLLIVSSFSMEMMAQKNLENVVKKCESSDSEAVSMNIIRKRNDKKQVTKVIITISISGNKELVNDFLEAAQKDEPDTVSSIGQKIGKKTYPSLYKFDNGVVFTFSMSKDDQGVVKDGYLNVTVIERDGSDL
jgi:hypothetical protein